MLEVNWPGGSKQYIYDGAGRPTQITSPAGNYLFTWNSQSQLTQLTGPSGTQNFTYNGSGARDSVTKGGVTNHVVRDGTSVLGSIVRQGGQEFKPGVAVREGLSTTWQHSGLKNFDWQSGGAATISGTKQFDAFGNQVGSTGTWVGPFSHAGPFGYQTDGDIPFQQVGHRWLDPTTGRFLTRDPIKDGRNWDSYGAGLITPTSMADPTGLWLEQTSDFFAGWGDTLTSGGVLPWALGYGSSTEMVRDWFGADEVVDKDSGYYTDGQVTGFVNAALMSPTAVARVAGARVVTSNTIVNPSNTYVLGRGMEDTIIPFARSRGLKTILDDLGNVPWDFRGWLMNLAWMTNKIGRGAHFIDLGGSVKGSSYYLMERVILKLTSLQ